MFMRRLLVIVLVSAHLESGHGFKPVRTEVLVVGVCDDCARNPARPTTRRRVIDPHHRH